jgi:uncharacterized protein
MTVAPAVARQSADVAGPATFEVLVSGTRVGSESVSITRNGTGWLLSGTGRLQVPFDLTVNKFEVTYGPDWQAERLTVDGQLRGQPMLLTSRFSLTSAQTELTQGSQHGIATHQVSARAVVLPTNVFAAYEVLAIRAATAPVGTRLPLYLAPNGEGSATVTEVTKKRVSIGSAALDLTAVRLTIGGATAATPVELWIDARGRLARLSLPASSIVVIRDDLASVMAREERAANPGDEDAFIGSNGFSLGATVTRPTTTGAAPAIVLVSGPGPQDRDYTIFGISVFGQLAGALANSGALVVRYDVRGIGRSGGRTESARLTEYSDDVVSIVRWLRKRSDVDHDRIVLAGYGDAGPIALVAASREKNVAGVVLLAAPGGSGRDITLAQQQRVLAPLQLSPAEKSTRIALEMRVIDAVVSGRGWDGLPEDVRQQADTLWFKSWLEYDPADVFRKLKQPVLILQGTLDAEVPVAEADRLEKLSASRTRLPATATRKVLIPGVNHLFVPATTGAVDEYPLLDARAIAPEVTSAIADWLEGLR